MNKYENIKIPANFIDDVVNIRFPDITQQERLQLYKLIYDKCKQKLIQECNIQKQIIKKDGLMDSNGVYPQCYFFEEDNIKVCGFYATVGALKGQEYSYSRTHSSDDGGLCFRLVDIRSKKLCKKNSCKFIGVIKKYD